MENRQSFTETSIYTTSLSLFAQFGLTEKNFLSFLRTRHVIVGRSTDNRDNTNTQINANLRLALNGNLQILRTSRS